MLFPFSNFQWISFWGPLRPLCKIQLLFIRKIYIYGRFNLEDPYNNDFNMGQSQEVLLERINHLDMVNHFFNAIQCFDDYSSGPLDFIKNPKDSFWDPNSFGFKTNEHIKNLSQAANLNINYFNSRHGAFINPPVKNCFSYILNVWSEYQKAYQLWITKRDNELFLEVEQNISNRIEGMRSEIFDSNSIILTWKSRELEFLEIVNSPFYKFKTKKDMKFRLKLHIQMLNRIRLMFEFLSSMEYRLFSKDFSFRTENAKYINGYYETLGESATYLFPIYSYLFLNISGYLEIYTSPNSIDDNFLELNSKDIANKIEAIDQNIDKSEYDLSLL